jgi:hypothetical protein
VSVLKGLAAALKKSELPFFLSHVTSIVTATGSKWKSQRLAGHQAFTRPANLSFFAERILPKHLRILIDGFEAVCQDDGKDGTVDVQEQAEQFAMALFGEMAYDVRTGPAPRSHHLH